MVDSGSDSTVFMSEDDVKRAVEEVLTHYSAEHLRWVKETRNESLKEKFAIIALSSLDPRVLSSVSQEKVLRHRCSQSSCGKDADIEEIH